MGVSNWLAVLVSALAFFAIGWVWYGPLFSKPWASGMGYDGDLIEQRIEPRIVQPGWVAHEHRSGRR